MCDDSRLHDSLKNCKYMNHLILAELTQDRNHLWILLREAHDRSKDSILTCDLKTDEIESLMEALQ